MTQEQKELLLKDLCGRLPYGVKFRYKYINNFFHEDYATSKLKGVLPPYHIMHSTLVGEDYLNIEDDEVRPYLFPLSSMTEEQEVEYDATFATIVYEDGRKDSVMTYKSFDWLNKNHFDYRGLIPKGSAIDCTNLNVY